jgi:hypothetical protein
MQSEYFVRISARADSDMESAAHQHAVVELAQQSKGW